MTEAISASARMEHRNLPPEALMQVALWQCWALSCFGIQCIAVETQRDVSHELGGQASDPWGLGPAYLQQLEILCFF